MTAAPEAGCKGSDTDPRKAARRARTMAHRRSVPCIATEHIGAEWGLAEIAFTMELDEGGDVFCPHSARTLVHDSVQLVDGDCGEEPVSRSVYAGLGADQEQAGRLGGRGTRRFDRMSSVPAAPALSAWWAGEDSASAASPSDVSSTSEMFRNRASADWAETDWARRTGGACKLQQWLQRHQRQGSTHQTAGHTPWESQDALV